MSATRVGITLLFLALAALAQAEGLTIQRNQARVVIAGNVSSEGHEKILLDLLEKNFTGLEHSIDLSLASNLPPRWSLTTSLTLRSLLHTDVGTAEISRDHVRFGGYTTTPSAWYAALARLGQNVSADIQIESDVTPMTSDKPLAWYCGKRFDATLDSLAIRFEAGSAELSTNTHAALDRLLELAMECPDFKVLVRASDNDSLGTSRSEATAAYLLNGGLEADRISHSRTQQVEPGSVGILARQAEQ